jgi:uncharacterized protein (TIGR03085 family)
VSQSERAALADLLERLGPDQPTRCAGWTTRDLAAHLVVRDRRPDSTPGLVLGGPFPGWTERVRQRAVRRPFPDLVSAVRSGPPAWLPTALPVLDRAFNAVEMTIHHEDVRRAGGTSPGPRRLPEHECQRVWKQLPLMARLRFRAAPVGVVLAQLGGARATVKKGAPAVTLTGEPVELALYTSGRRSAAHVQVSGPPDAVERFQGWVTQT